MGWFARGGRSRHTSNERSAKAQQVGTDRVGGGSGQDASTSAAAPRVTTAPPPQQTAMAAAGPNSPAGDSLMASSLLGPAQQQQLQQAQQQQQKAQQQEEQKAQQQQQQQQTQRVQKEEQLSPTSSAGTGVDLDRVDDGDYQEREDSDDDGLMVIDRPPSSGRHDKRGGHRQQQLRDIESDVRSGEENEEEQEYSTMHNMAVRQNHLNSLFNGHLMKWKFEAEEGSAFVRVPAFFGALGLIVTAIMALVTIPDAWTSHSIVMSVCVITMAVFIIILDGRFLATNPLSARAHLRDILTRNFNIFRFVWGRGLLYIAAGVLNVAQLWLITIISGAVMIGIGIIALSVGIHASRKFAALRNSLADESFLLLVFSNCDGDGDGYIAPYEFALLLADLGMELDDRYTLKAFNAIDTDNDRKISFEEFSHWWASGYIERGRKRLDDDEEYGAREYRRMD